MRLPPEGGCLAICLALEWGRGCARVVAEALCRKLYCTILPSSHSPTRSAAQGLTNLLKGARKADCSIP